MNNETKDIAIIGAGPAGVFAAMNIADDSTASVYVFDGKKPLTTLLPTGGGRCNLSYYEPDISEFVMNYPRGAKFLFSVFNRFDMNDTVDKFEQYGIKTYVQADNRIFPVSDSSQITAEILLKRAKLQGINFIKETVNSVTTENAIFTVVSDKNSYNFKKIILATGGKNFDIAQSLGHKIISPAASLVPLKIKEKSFYDLSGLSLKNVSIKAFFNGKKIASTHADMLFTAKSLSGPGIFKISSDCAFTEFSLKNPLVLKINVTGKTPIEAEDFISNCIKKHPRMLLKNILSLLIPQSLALKLLEHGNVNPDKEITHLSNAEKRKIVELLTELCLTVTSRDKAARIVTAGGVNLDEINAKTMESKIVPGLYFAGELINADGYTGGFNLQLCWSTAYICAKNIISE